MHKKGATLVLALVCGACANAPSKEQRAYFDQQAAAARDLRASLVSDTCVVRDEVGSDYVLRQASKDAGIAARRAAASYLRGLGYQLTYAVTPFVCGVTSLTGDAAQVDVAEVEDGEKVKTTVPIPLLGRLHNNAALSDSYRKMFKQVGDAISADQKESPSNQGKATPLAMAPQDLALLKQDLGTSRVWVLETGGVQVSAVKSVGVGVLTSVISLALSGGTYLYMAAPVDGHGHEIALLDLDSNEIIWKKFLSGQHGDPAVPASYTKEWAQTLFEPFIPKPGKASKTAAAD